MSISFDLLVLLLIALVVKDITSVTFLSNIYMLYFVYLNPYLFLNIDIICVGT